MELFDAITALREVQVAIEPTTEMRLSTLKTSISEGIAVYDAIYVAVALMLNAKLVTSDETLVERLSKDIKRRTTLLSKLSLNGKIFRPDR